MRPFVFLYFIYHISLAVRGITAHAQAGVRTHRGLGVGWAEDTYDLETEKQKTRIKLVIQSPIKTSSCKSHAHHYFQSYCDSI